MEGCGEHADQAGGTGGDDFDVAVWRVAHPAAQAERGGFAVDEPAEAYALNTALNEEVLDDGVGLSFFRHAFQSRILASRAQPGSFWGSPGNLFPIQPLVAAFASVLLRDGESSWASAPVRKRAEVHSSNAPSGGTVPCCLKTTLESES